MNERVGISVHTTANECLLPARDRLNCSSLSRSIDEYGRDFNPIARDSICAVRAA